MELHHLRTFVAVAEEQNVTRAARRLYMTPPAVSAHIKALEEELNIVLFTRLPQGMQLTDKGTLLKQKADQILQAAQELVNHATRMQDDLIGRLVIGLNASTYLLKTAPLIQHMREVCPGIDLTFTTSVSGAILNRLRTHTIDLGFIFGISPDQDVISIPLTVVDLMIAAPKAWEAQIQQAEWADIARLPWIHSTGYCPFQMLIDQQFRDRGLTVSQIVHADDEAIKSELVSAGLGLALLERGDAQTGNFALWNHAPIRCTLSAAIAKDRQDDPLVSALLSQVLQVWAVSADVS